MAKDKMLSDQTQKAKLMLTELWQHLESYESECKTASLDTLPPASLSPVNKKIAIGN
jgi:hypothetical protein